ncbi:T7SS effector LXG polymorphic toxin [Metabacillus halosaccharovorans]|uniref:T7SS effector LXG polymorphic toxin n=1 Tax=Metabacillus halosaccharovorans TaxID=930124 RepID=A0ABT3DH99_9BACI|nr:T7SS effector LXG polymorphic toxin [Metabacillus halosaccharovorans]MCV9886413.1 T7SS effector LXG polymorphic toxin [Metabacillus halosaccharovorans]
MANVKVLESKTLIESMEDRSTVYKDLREKLDKLKVEFTDIVQLDDNLTGKGADAIKGFYQAQVDVVEALIRFVDMQIAFFNGVSGSIDESNLSGDTIVDVNFLETDLSIQATNHIAMVDSQQEDLKKIFKGIDDIVSLDAFSTDQFDTAMSDAKKKREDTVKAVDSLDQQLKEEYMVSESAEYHIAALFQQLLEATAQGNTIQPINFDSQAYKASEAYQLTDEVEQYANEYLTFKEEQEKFREELKKAEELENRPWYEKAWDGVKTFTGEITGYYDYLRASEGVDPVTGEKLTAGQRVAAGAMATAGFIPVVGWAGRIFKGGSAIYKTAKGMNAADRALDVYRTSKTFSNLEMAEMGIYGLVSANGFSEYITGKDMFGNELTLEQQENSLAQALGLLAVGGGAYYVNRLQDGSRVLDEVPIENAEKIVEITQADREKLSKWAYPPKEEKYIKYKEVYDNPKYYDQESGNINWPPNDGFDGEPMPTELKKGMLIDRFGAPGGGFFSPEGIPYEQRALALHSDEADYYIYRVLEDFEVTGGKIAPWFDRPGGGTQFIKYHSNGKAYSMEELEELELIEFVSVKKGG